MHSLSRFGVLIDYQEILRYLRHIKEFWFYLLQQDNVGNREQYCYPCG